MGKRSKQPTADPDEIPTDSLKLDFGKRFVDFRRLTPPGIPAEAPSIRKLPPKPGRAPLPTSLPGKILNPHQRRRDSDS